MMITYNGRKNMKKKTASFQCKTFIVNFKMSLTSSPYERSLMV